MMNNHFYQIIHTIRYCILSYLTNHFFDQSQIITEMKALVKATYPPDITMKTDQITSTY